MTRVLGEIIKVIAIFTPAVIGAVGVAYGFHIFMNATGGVGLIQGFFLMALSAMGGVFGTLFLGALAS